MSSKKLSVTRVWQSQRLWPVSLLLLSSVLLLLWGGAEMLGMREYASFLSGTSTSLGGMTERSSFFGVSYVLLYFCVVLFVPVFSLMAFFFVGWDRYSRMKEIRSSSSIMTSASSMDAQGKV